jgi:hypothetical protein
MTPSIVSQANQWQWAMLKEDDFACFGVEPGNLLA